MATAVQPIAYKVNGIIYDENDLPLKNVLVKVFDKDLRAEKLLGEKLTDAKGSYAITFKPEVPLNPEYKTADVFVKVFDTAGLLLGQSPVNFNVAEETTINYKIGNTPYKGVTEFDALLAIIEPIVKSNNVLLGDLQKNDKFDDFSFLAGETGEDAERIRLLNTASAYSKTTTIAADIFYGLFRMGFPTVLNELLLIKADSIKKAVQQAINENIISSKWGKGIDKVILAINELAVKKITEGNDEQALAFKKLFDSALLPKLQKTFVQTYFDNEEQPEKFWEILKDQDGFNDPLGVAINKTKQLLSLHSLTDNQPELAQQLFKKQTSDADLKDLRGFAKFSKADWEQQITAAAVSAFPAWVKGATTAEKTAHYAESLETLHKQLYPTTFFASRMKQDTDSAFSNKAQLTTFFSKNPNFELNTKNINKQLDAAIFENIIDKEAVKKELKTINRLYKLTDDYKQVNALYGKNLFSATDVVRKYGKDQFVKQFTTITGGPDKAKLLFRNAVSVNNKIDFILAGYKMRYDIPLHVMDGGQPAPKGYHEMFNDGELCECEHCQSVYSPVAYFVDMLSFIKSENKDAFDRLLSRRPDLNHILLTCKNTNTSLPYIDLVNELLEKKVLALSAPTGVDPFSIENHSFQTEGLPAELIAMPEHVNHNAYNALKTVSGNAVFSPLLPLDLPLEELRLYAEKLGLKREELMVAFYGNNTPGIQNDVNLAAELFGFANAELAIINGSNPFTGTLPLTEDGKCTIKDLLIKTKFTYIELLQLLETYFLNPIADGERRIKIVQVAERGEELPLLTCNLDKLLLAGANNAWLNKAVRFVRLWGKMGWDIFDIDRALTALGITDFPVTHTEFNEKVLIPFARIEKTKHWLNLPIQRLVSFYTDIDNAIYLDHAKEGQPRIISLQDELFRGIGVNNVETLCAAFRISAADYADLEAEADFSLPNLSKLYRQVLLAKALGISISDLKEVISITGNSTGAHIWTPEKLSEFLEQWKTFKSAGIKISEFKGCFNAVPDEEYTIPVDYILMKSVINCTKDITEIQNNTTNTDEQRKVYSVEKLSELLQSLGDNVLLNEALDLLTPLSNPTDAALNTVLENYLEEANWAMLLSLPIGEMINKLESLSKSFHDYTAVVLKKAPALFEKLRFEALEILWMKDNKEALGIEILWNESIDFNANTYKAFGQLYLLSVLAKIKNNTSVTWIDLIDLTIHNQLNTKADWFAKAVSLYNISESSLEFLLGSKNDINQKGKLNFSFPVDYNDAAHLVTIFDCCRMIEKQGANPAQMNALLIADASVEHALALLNLMKSKYDNKELLDIIKPINYKLRNKKRDALVAWLLANTNDNKWNPADANDIYEILLIDTEMGSCMVTSRIKQAISSVQLYIDRCLMNLESGISLNDDFAKQWHTWRKQYRVWEANRKIFLYPENWIVSDLRDDKSPFFKELESQLKQNEVTEETAKEALITYLQKLDTVANLEMVGLFNDEETNIVHVFGRTHNIPHQYFYRKQENNVWTAWEKVEVDIEGDHILPVVWNGRLMLFWGMFTEKEERSGGFEVPGKGDIIEEPAKYWEMKLFWSECKNGKWGAKKLSNEQLRLFRKNIIHDHRNGSNKTHTVYLKKEDCSLTSSITNTGLSVNILLRRYGFVNRRSFYARFHFDFCHSFPVLKDIQTTLPSWYIQNASGTRIDLMTVSEWNKDNFNLFDKGVYRVDSPGNSDPIRSEVILNNTPGIFRLSTSHHAIWQEKPSDFFYGSNEKNFYVKALPSINHSLDLLAIKNPGVAIFRITAGIDEKDIDSGQSSENLREIRKSEANKFNSVDIPVIISSTDIAPHKDISVYKYRFENFYHPYVCSYIKKLNTKSIDDLYRKNVQNRELKNIFTTTEYDPTSLVLYPYPKEEVDFSYAGSYSLYNWELFFHIPLFIATRLTQNQKFEEARKWFHYIFDPTSTSNEDTGATRFWITKPFRNEIKQGIMPLEDLLNLEENADELEIQLSNWEQNPFNPHAIARLRISAYMRNTVLRYIDNLIQWGDQLFKRDTIESINEATLLYILASNILGKKQETVPARAKPVEKSFSNIAGELDRFGNVKDEIETFISPSSGNDTLLMPYFCLPKNDYLLKYWDTVADRLFKIRHCMNIEGTVRQLPLFEPPIDPALLVRATAAGLNLNEILNDMNAVLPNYRFQVMLQLANELCNDVKSLGSSLLSALEKKDGEELALLRSIHELRMLEVIRDIKENQRDEAKANLEGLIRSKEIVENREDYYSGRQKKNDKEQQQLNSLKDALSNLELAIYVDLAASALVGIPQTTIGAWSWGATFGGQQMAGVSQFVSSSLNKLANYQSSCGGIAGIEGGYERRKDDWDFQANSANLELKQIDKQIIASEIRLAIAEREIENHSLQMEQSREVDDYMRSKFTNTELYDWMVGQLSTVYFQSYQLAYSTAKKAEKCLQHELGLEGTNFVQFGYWDSLKKGLLSGEKLQYDLRRLENTYLELNKREYEIVKHISISMLDPLALIKLRSTGSCDFEIPEVLYDMDHSGQFFRRLKSVSISLPCIAGPYTSVSAKLSLVNDRYRKNTNPDNAANTGFAEYPGNDDRFIYNIGAIKSISTSNAQNDSGVFELNFRDERYLPFEGCGAISKWKLELPSAIRQFDYNTISDMILHVKYTSRDGSDVFKGLVEADLINRLGIITQQLVETGLHIAINLKHDLPDQWYVLKENGSVDLKIDKSRLPYFAQSLKANIKSVLFIVKCTTLPPSTVDSISMNLVLPATTTNETITLSKITEWNEMPQGQSILKSQNVNQIELDSAFKISIDKTQFDSLDELIMLVKFNF